MQANHPWTFFRAGGSFQVKLESGADLMNLDSLDQKLWVALACPTSGLEISARTLSLIDSDKDGRVRAVELIAAVKFAGENLKNPDDLLKGDSVLPLAAIKDSSPEGKALLASARQILKNIGKADADGISIEDVFDTAGIFRDTAFNGDGVITELSTSDAASRAILLEIRLCMGEEADLSGKMGIGSEKIEAFFTEAKAYGDWQTKGQTNAKSIFPLGFEKTVTAVSAMVAIKPKLDDYFSRCRLAQYDSRALQMINGSEEAYTQILAQDLSLSVKEMSAFPLAKIASDGALHLSGPFNPAHAVTMENFIQAAVEPILGKLNDFTEQHWQAVQAKLADYQAWEAEKPGQRMDLLGKNRVEEILSSDLERKLKDLVRMDKALEAETAGIERVERLVCYYRDIALLCTNFVNFKNFYDGSNPSVFQCGTLFLDQRACHLCLRVEDPAKHASMAGLAGAYLAYLDCQRKGTVEKMQIVAAFTAGDSDNLMLGRNGVFYDRKGQDWDATIIRIVDNPISIGQAIWSPYKKFARFLEEQVNKRAAAADAVAHNKLTVTAENVVNADKTKPSEPKKIDVGTVAAIGVAAGAIGTFFTALIGYSTGIFKQGALPTLGAIIGVLLLISAPSVVMAYMKLRKRNLGPILDANGWAVNAKAKINVPFGSNLTSVAKLPKGSKRDSSDRYAERRIPWKRLLLALVIIYGFKQWVAGSFDRILPVEARPSSLFFRFY